MNICFALWHLNGYRGTQTWVVAAARAMKALGHKVSLYTVERGRAAMRLEPEFNIYSMSHVNEVPKQDVLVVSQPRTFFECGVCGLPAQPDSTGFALSHKKGKRPCPGSGFRMKLVLPSSQRTIYVCHGVMFWQDAPVQSKVPYAAVSEEVQEFLKKHKAASRIVRQPVDLATYVPGPMLRQSRPIALSFSAAAAERALIQAACDKAEFELIHPPTTEQWDIVPLLHSADIVIGSGRGVCEAMACGRSAIVCSKYGCDGLLSPATLDHAMSHNFSGRATGGDVAEGLAAALNDYDPELGPWSLETARKHFDAKANIPKLLEAAC